MSSLTFLAATFRRRPASPAAVERWPGREVLVCVKRVPMTGGRIVLTEDGQAIETKHLGFAISPHEECGVEEAVRLVEQHGGESVVLTLGPADAEEQLRDAMAIGVDRGIHLVSDGEEWDPEATAGAIVEAVAADEAASGRFDLIFFGNESADSGGFQVGLRAALRARTALCDGAQERGRRRRHGALRAGGGRAAGTSTSCRCRRSSPSLEGLNLPRYPSVPGRMRAGRKPLERADAHAAGGEARTGPARGAGRRVEAGRGPRARRGRSRRGRRPSGADRSGIVNLVLVEHADGVATDVSLQALALAATLEGDTHALLIGPGGAVAAQSVPVAVAHVAEHDCARRLRSRRVGCDRLRDGRADRRHGRSWRPGPGTPPT